jgi:hypothetical protein
MTFGRCTTEGAARHRPATVKITVRAFVSNMCRGRPQWTQRRPSPIDGVKGPSGTINQNDRCRAAPTRKPYARTGKITCHNAISTSTTVKQKCQLSWHFMMSGRRDSNPRPLDPQGGVPDHAYPWYPVRATLISTVSCFVSPPSQVPPMLPRPHHHVMRQCRAPTSRPHVRSHDGPSTGEPKGRPAACQIRHRTAQGWRCRARRDAGHAFPGSGHVSVRDTDGRVPSRPCPGLRLAQR